MSRYVCLWSLCVLLGLCIHSSAAERPTFNKNTCDPRPDVLPYWLHSGHPEYRRAYNRPRHLTGWITYVIEPSSQEAMVWCEAKQLGLYRKPHAPPMYKKYYAPRAWELLDVGPRPDFVRQTPGGEANEVPIETNNYQPTHGLIEDSSAKVQLANEIQPANDFQATSASTRRRN
jgi:hypothetical protein